MNDKPLVLIVDDEAVFREIMSVQLEAGGIGVAVASTPKDALQKAEQLQPNLILMDIHLGGGETGTDAALELKQNPKTENLHIAFLTNMKDPWPGVVGDNSKVAREIGMQDFLSKTDDPQVNLQKVRVILGLDQPASTPTQLASEAVMTPPPLVAPEEQFTPPAVVEDVLPAQEIVAPVADVPMPPPPPPASSSETIDSSV